MHIRSITQNVANKGRFYIPGLILILLLTPAAAAQTNAAEIIRNEIEIDFPETVTFKLEVESDSRIADAELKYQVGQRSCLDVGTQVPVEADGPIMEWTWVMSRSGNPPPGANMWWQWTVSFEDGSTIITPRQETTFQDDRFDWRSISGEEEGLLNPITLYWYEGDDVGSVLYEAAVEGLQRLQDEMGISLRDEVKIFIYGDSADMREALLYIQDWAGGAAFSEYSTVLIGVPPHQADSWGTDTVRHELAHLVIDQFAQSCVGGSRPTWLNEGLAMYAEGEPGETVLTDIEEGIREDSFQPVRSLNGPFPAQGDGASAAYSQSYSLVEFLLVEYGREKIQDLLLALAASEPYDQALEDIYGFNSDGLESAWRAYLGAQPRQIPPTPTAILAANVPTIVPLEGAKSWPTPYQNEIIDPAASTEVDEGTSGICGLALFPLIFTAVTFEYRRRRSSPNGP